MESELGKSRFDYMTDLAELSKAKTLDLALQQSIAILRNLFGTRRVNIYWLDNESMVFRKKYGYDPQKQMPKQIPNSDMLMLSKPMVWRNNQFLEDKSEDKASSDQIKNIHFCTDWFSKWSGRVDFGR